jgi:TPR repeat protein
MKKILIFFIVFFELSLSFSVLAQSSDAAFRAAYAGAEQGDPASLFTIGKIYIDGTSSAGKDASKGLEYITRSANKGNLQALKFLAQMYESGSVGGKNESKALDVFLQIQKTGDNSYDSKIAELFKKLAPKPLTTAFCKKVDEAVNNMRGSDSPKGALASCVLAGMSNLITQADAVRYLKDDIRTNRASFISLATILLDKNNPDWDPKFIEDNFSSVGMSSKDPDVLQIFKKYAVTFDGCRKLDPEKRENLKQRPSVCRLAALSGDSEAAVYVGDAYLNGRDYFDKNSRLAKDYLFIAYKSNNSQISTEALPLLLDSLQAENNFREHFAIIKDEMKGRGARADIASQKFGYEIDFVISSANNLDIDEISTIIDLAIKANISSEQKQKLAAQIPSIIEKKGRLLKPVEKEYLLKGQQELMSSNGSSMNVWAVKQVGGSSYSEAKTPPITTSPPAVSAPISNPYVAQQALAVQPSDPSMEQLKALESSCKSKQAIACVQAGLILTAEKPLQEIFLIRESQRIIRALRLYETAIELGNLEAMELAYGFYHDPNFIAREFNSYTDKERASELLATMVSKNYPGGLLLQAQDYIVNPKYLDDVAKKKEACGLVRQYLLRTDISSTSHKIAKDLNSGLACTLF